MRILYLTGGFPYPLTSGYLRHYYLIKELSQRHTITLLSVVGPGFRTEHAAAMEPFTKIVLTFRSTGRGRSALGKVADSARSVLTRETAELQMRQAIERLLASEAFDVVLFSGKETYTAIEGLQTPPVVADFTDAASMRIQGQMHYAKKRRVPVLWLKYRRTRRFERKIMARAEHGLFASLRDRDVLMGSSPHKATVVPNGVNLDFWTRTTRSLGRNTLIFTGAMNYAPNVDAALHLIRDILPLVQRTMPAVEVLIVGHSPKPALVAAGQQPGVTVTGFVDDVRPYLERASLFVAPLRFGAGIQNKLLEAMAMEVPVISSSLAADGLRTEEGEIPPVHTADTAQAVANLICQELERRSAALDPDAEARQFVEKHFDWKASAEKAHRIIEAVGSNARVERL